MRPLPRVSGAITRWAVPSVARCRWYATGLSDHSGLVETKPYRGLFLTEAGHVLAAAARERHRLVTRFLMALGLDQAAAEADAEGLEHHASQATLDAFARVLDQQGQRSPASTDS